MTRRKAPRYVGVRLKFDFAMLYNEPIEVCPNDVVDIDVLKQLRLLRDRVGEAVEAIEIRRAGKKPKVDRFLLLNAWSMKMIRPVDAKRASAARKAVR